ncbi:MerR family transcriptional regulator [Nocardiopsis alba]|uniref:MerR family transcriptional regulator n=1 Tax=Nocardiopsis alba TaxID=53437 RepID=UPI00362FF2C0
MNDALTPGAAARLLGVAPTTLRSWDRRYGIGPGERSPGGHRRYSPADMDRLRELCRLVGEGFPPASAARRVLEQDAPTYRSTSADVSSEDSPDEVHRTGHEATYAPSGGSLAPSDHGSGRPSRRRSGGDTLPLGPAPPLLQGIARAAMRMDCELVERLLWSALEEHGTVATWENLAMPLLYGMGRKWEDTRRYVEVEHLLSWSVSSVLRRVTGPASSTTRPVVLACLPHEMHGLPLEALAAALRERGRPQRVLGPCTPAEATVRTIARTAPSAVVLWCHAKGDQGVAPLRAVARATGAGRLRTALYTAGPGWREAGPLTRITDGHLSSLTEAMTHLLR